MNSVGFRPAQVRSKIEVIATGTDTSRLEVIDQSVYISDDDANFRTEIETYLFNNVIAEQGLTNFAPAALGARPTSVETFSIPGALATGPQLGFSLAWVYDDDALPWELRVGLNASDMATQIYHLGSQGYRPISLSSRERGGISEYSAVFVDDGMPNSDWEVSLGIDDFDIEVVAQDKWDNGFYAFRGTTEHGTWTRFNMIWTKRPPGLALEPRFNLTLSTFQTEDALRRAEGYHLESLDRYLLNGYDRYAAIWVRYEPCLRWAGTWFGANDPDYVSKYKMFHDQALLSMNFTAMNPGAQWIRPSSTLHIVDGGQTVLNRAYTFAPAIYPDTQIDAPFRLASISKSITAAAVVDVMNDASLPLTTSFTTAANIANSTPANMNVPTVRDTLRNLGGFRGRTPVTVNGVLASAALDPVSYWDHALIDATAFGSFPIGGQEMLDYAIGDNHLDMGPDTDSYWDVARFNDSQNNTWHHYSNTGFSLLGELVRRRSGVSYEQYVISNFLAPPNLHQKIYRDTGHRKDDRGPTAAGLRAYLMNGDHPYRTTPPASPLFGTEPLPTVTLGVLDDAMRWDANAGPSGPTVPESASRGRYAGRTYVGGAPLAAGGWVGDGASVASLIRLLADTGLLVPSSIISQVWASQWKVSNGVPTGNWDYGLGWYVRGNWVAWAGGSSGAMGTAMHNNAYAFTVIHLTNTIGNGLAAFAFPLMLTTSPGAWDTSQIGQAFPCTPSMSTECTTTSTPY